MKLLQLCKEMEVDLSPSFRHMINEKRKKEYNKKDHTFFNFLICWLGGRMYNQFLDYSLLAIKLNHLFNKMKGINTDSWFGTKENNIEDIKELIECLLYDDRHDLYQNMPYILNKIYISMESGPDKDNFWDYIINATIDCINVHGTGNISASFVVEE